MLASAGLIPGDSEVSHIHPNADRSPLESARGWKRAVAGELKLLVQLTRIGRQFEVAPEVVCLHIAGAL